MCMLGALDGMIALRWPGRTAEQHRLLLNMLVHIIDAAVSTARAKQKGEA